MSIEIPDPLKPAKWDSAVKNLAKDKAVSAKLDPDKVGTALKNLGAAHGKVDFAVFEPEVKTAAEGEKALAAIDAALKGPLKDARGAAKLAEGALDDFAAAAEKIRKTFQGDSGKLVVAVMGEASKASDAATKLEKDLGQLAVDAKTEVVALLQKLKGAAKKDPAGKPADSKAQKFLKSKMLECIRKIKTPAPGAKPWRFLVVKGTSSVAFVTLNTVPGGTHEKMLKSMLSGQKCETKKDPKGEIVWENKAMTLVSDRLTGVSAKKLQEWCKKLTNVNLKCRIRKSTGEVDEAPGDDIDDAALKPDAAEVAEKATAGKDWEARLGKLKDPVKAAIASGIPTEMKGDIKRLVAEIMAAGKAKNFEEAADALEELESMLDEDVTAVAAAAPSSGLSIKDLTAARALWGRQRTHAIGEITALVATIQKDYKGQDELAGAMDKIKGAMGLLKPELEAHLDETLKQKDPDKQLECAAKAKRTLDDLRDLLENNDVLLNLDRNDIMPNMYVVGPMKKSLDALEAALG